MVNARQIANMLSKAHTFNFEISWSAYDFDFAFLRHYRRQRSVSREYRYYQIGAASEFPGSALKS